MIPRTGLSAPRILVWDKPVFLLIVSARSILVRGRTFPLARTIPASWECSAIAGCNFIALFAKFQAGNNNGTISLGSSVNRGVYDETTSKWLIASSKDGKTSWVSWKEGDTAANNLTYKFGIGTNSPTSKLHVVGNIYSTTEQTTDTYMQAGTYVRASGGDVYVGSTAGSQCHMKYDDTNKCLKFIFD
jgi:hypothetical protein